MQRSLSTHSTPFPSTASSKITLDLGSNANQLSWTTQQGSKGYLPSKLQEVLVLKLRARPALRLREIIQDLPAHQYQEALQWKPPQDAEREALNRDEEGDGDFSVARGQDKLLVGAVQRLSVFMKWAAKEENRDKKFHKNDLQFSCLETYKKCVPSHILTVKLSCVASSHNAENRVTISRKKKFNWLDFDDLIPLTIELLKCDYRLLDDFRSRHRVILVRHQPPQQTFSGMCVTSSV